MRVANFIEHDARIWDSHKLFEVLPLPVVSTILKVQIRHQSIQDSFKWIALMFHLSFSIFLLAEIWGMRNKLKFEEVSMRKDRIMKEVIDSTRFAWVSGKGAIGVVATDADGVIRATGYRRILAGNAQEAELLAVEGALILALQKGFRKIKVK
ncbi:hypothetical protein FRX31_006407, partial [Thalictrum thalictroides]